jgi:hypothetical protein
VWLRCVLVCAGLCCWPLAVTRGAAQAAEVAVSISVDRCVPVDHEALHRLLAIELGTSTAHEPGPKVPTRVWVSCSSLGIELRLEDGVTSKTMARTLPASSFRDTSSTRLLALAVAEFVVASWIELGVQPDPIVPPVPIAPPPSQDMRQAIEQAIDERAEPTEGLSVTGALALAVWTDNGSLWLGAGARVTREASPTMAWSVSFDFTGTSNDVEFGRVHGLSGSIAFSALFYLRLAPLTLFTGPGARVGVVRLAGEPADEVGTKGGEFAAPFGGPLWLARVDLALSRSVRLGIELEGGFATLPAKATADREGSADPESIFALEGLWLSPALSLGASF